MVTVAKRKAGSRFCEPGRGISANAEVVPLRDAPPPRFTPEAEAYLIETLTEFFLSIPPLELRAEHADD